MEMVVEQWNSRSVARERTARAEVWWVLHLTARKRGSMEQQLVALAERLRARGVGFTCVFAAPPAEWLARELERCGVEVRALDFAARSSALTLGRWLGAARPALVHFHFVRAFSPLVAAARLAGARVVVNDHVTLTRASASPIYEAAKRLRTRIFGALCDRRVAVSSFVAESVRAIEHVAPDRVEVIENGVDVARFRDADGRAVRAELGASTRPLIVCVSRLQGEKGVESAVRALPMIGRDALLALVGDGPLLADLRALAARLGVADRVRFLGVRDDVEQLIAAADVIVVPSHWDEAFGLAVVEGMAAGRPVVVTASGAMPAIVGDAGLVVPKRDPGALAGAVTRLLDDPLLAARLGRAGRARAEERYGMQRFVGDVLALYDRLAPALAA